MLSVGAGLAGGFKRGRGGRGSFSGRGRGGTGFNRGTSLPVRNSTTGRFVANGGTSTYKPTIGQLEAGEDDQEKEAGQGQEEEYADGLNM